MLERTAVAFLAALVSFGALQDRAPQDPVAQDPVTQDPVRLPSPPVGSDPLPPVPPSMSITVDRRELGQAWLPASPIEGFWQSSAWSVNGRAMTEGFRAFLAVGRAHLSIQVLEMPAAEIRPSVQAGTRTYRLENGALVTSSLIGFDNYGDRKLHLEPIGLVERRTVQFVGGRLRISKGKGNWIEFERIE